MDNIWWGKITNPSRFIDDIKTAATYGSSLIVILPSATPWEEDCKEEIKNGLYQKTDRAIDVHQDAQIDPGQMMLEAYCKPEKRLEYRPAIGYAKFLGTSDDTVLNDTYVWVEDIGSSRLKAWTDFVAEYIKQRGGKPGGVFLLFTKEPVRLLPKKGIQVISYDDYTSSFDTFVFAMLKSSEAKIRPHEKQYLATLVSELAGNDAELSDLATSSEYYGRFLTDPVATIREISDNRTKSNGSPFNLPYTDDELGKKVWKAQINTLFPLIEEYRSRFVQAHYKEIKGLLPIENPTQADEKYTEPEEVEIGVLKYLAGNRALDLPYEEFAELSRVRDARNNLAHLKTIDYDQIGWLLDTLPDKK